MCKLRAVDFYYGAFLSALLNTSGRRPVLFEETASLRIYRMETNNMRDCYVITKFVTRKEADAKGRWNWGFNFTDAEIERVQSLYQKSNNVKLALICVKEGLAESEIVVVDYVEAMDCLGVGIGVKSYRINIKTPEGKEYGLRMYGSGRSDKLQGKDNTLRVTRKTLQEL